MTLLQNFELRHGPDAPPDFLVCDDGRQRNDGVSCFRQFEEKNGGNGDVSHCTRFQYGVSGLEDLAIDQRVREKRQ